MKKIIISISLIMTIGLMTLILSGCMGKSNESNSSEGSSAVISGGVQTVTTKITPDSYPEITVQKGVPVKWTIKADEKDINNCNNEIQIPSLNITKKLVPGDNIIEFTPEKSDTIPYNCWMNMIKSNINVVDDITKVSNEGAVKTKSSNETNASNANNTNNTNQEALNGIKKAKVGADSQSVTTSLSGGKYEPIVVEKGVPVKWVVSANKNDINSCNNKVISEDFNFDKKFVAGDNEITFIPKQTGTYVYTCWMGMESSTITVVDNINKITQADIDGYNTAISQAGTGYCNMSTTRDEENKGNSTNQQNNTGSGCCGI